MSGASNIATGSLESLELYYSYADEDESLLKTLDKHLMNLQRQGIIVSWSRCRLDAGANITEESMKHLNSARLILLLISPDYLASDYAYEIELKRALERHARKEALVIPIHIRPVDWQGAPFANLPCLPRGALATTSWKNQDEAFHAIAEGIREVIEFLPSEKALEPLLSTPHISDVPQYPSKVSQENTYRLRMLERVRKYWIDGPLESSVAVLTNLGFAFKEDESLVANPWRMVWQPATEQLAQPLPLNTSIAQVYDAAGGQLLILGGAGAGKTTQLLLLARDLLMRAEHDNTHPLPIVFSLSSWTMSKRSLDGWLIEELQARYSIPQELAKAWIEENQLILLLDGLDEVAIQARDACIDAINTHLQNHRNTPMVVCSRNEEYITHPKRLLLRVAVILQPLTPVQIDTYLANAGPSFDGLRHALHMNARLQELVKSPFVLNILMYTLQNQPERLANVSDFELDLPP